MSLPVFPTLPGLAWPVPKSAEFNTLVQDSPNFMETRIPQSRNPRWHWELIFEVLRETATLSEYRQLQGFLLALNGQAGDFCFSDPTDNAVGPALIGGVPNTAAQLQVVNDGAGHYFSPVQRSFGGQFLEDITDLNGAIAVYDNGVLQTQVSSAPAAGQFVLAGPGLAVSGDSFMGMYLQWGAAPTGPVTAQFNFYFRCRMEEDTQQFEQFLSSMWTMGGSEGKTSGSLKFMSSRIPQV
jgi:Conserved hypothetical protein 2217 (DUF2460)